MPNRNEPGQEYTKCMFFDDTSEVFESCSHDGYNISTIEIPLHVVDAIIDKDVKQAIDYCSRGCFITMPLVLCYKHTKQIYQRSLELT